MYKIGLMTFLITAQLFGDMPSASSMSSTSESSKNSQYDEYKISCDKVFDAFGRMISRAANNGKHQTTIRYFNDESKSYNKEFFQDAHPPVWMLIQGSCPTEVIGDKLAQQGFKGNIKQSSKSIYDYDISW